MEIRKIDDAYEKLILDKQIKNPLSFIKQIVYNSNRGANELKLKVYTGLDHLQLSLLVNHKTNPLAKRLPTQLLIPYNDITKVYNNVMTERIAIQYFKNVYISEKTQTDVSAAKIIEGTFDFEMLFSTKFSGLAYLKKKTIDIRQNV